MPAYCAGLTLNKIYEAIPREIIDDILLVDDCSLDNTVEISKSLGYIPHS